MSARRHVQRRGVILYTAIMVVLLLSLVVFTLQSFVQNEATASQRVKGNEVAFEVARAGMAAGVARFENTADPSPLFVALSTITTAGAGSLPSESVDVAAHPALGAVLDGVEATYGDRPTLEVTLDTVDFQRLLPSSSPSGMLYNDVEKVGCVRITSIARFRHSRRKLVALKKVIVVSTLPYVVSKFTLFSSALHTGGSPAVTKNFLNVGQVEPSTFDTAKLVPGTAGYVTLNHGASPDLEERGFVFLGSADDVVLNICWGRGDVGEEHHVLEGQWAYSDPTPAPAPGHQLGIIQKGMFTGIHAKNNIFDFFDFTGSDPDSIRDRVSLLKLFGTGADPSPTIALGRLRRRFLAFRYILDPGGNQIVLPFAPAEATAPPSIMASAFGGDFATYQQWMSIVVDVDEPYNSSADFMQGPQTNITMPETLQTPTRVSHLDGLGDFLYRPEENDGRVRLQTTDGVVLFQGGLRAIATADHHLVERTTAEVAVGSLAGFLDSQGQRVPGVVHASGGDLTIGSALSLRDGGLIWADGDIIIRAPITVDGAGRPLALVSLTGNIRLETDETVEASLVALSGTVEKEPAIDVNVLGNIVVGTLDAEELVRDGGRFRVVYDERLDVTEPGTTSYSVHVVPGLTCYQDAI